VFAITAAMTKAKGDVANTLINVLDSKSWFVPAPPLAEDEAPSLLHMIRSGLYKLGDAVCVRPQHEIGCAGSHVACREYSQTCAGCGPFSPNSGNISPPSFVLPPSRFACLAHAGSAVVSLARWVAC